MYTPDELSRITPSPLPARRTGRGLWHARLLALGLTALLVAVLATPTLAAAGAGAARPKIGLVLGGGGARGAAHIGVLRVL
ncbi:MAG: hypothetical protein MUF60_06860, partial [Vicinamibacterales bacterium]|nr:hypothetical protein [Vicinamibacterales bacterium]